MVVYKKSKALLLNLRNPDKVLSVIDTAKTLDYQGNRFVVVPHRIPEYKLLANLGFDPPHPVDYYYQWPGTFTPMEAQRATVRLLTAHKRAYCLNDLGVGKTLASLWSFDYLRSAGLAKGALIVAPLSTLDRTWASELMAHFPHLEFAVLHHSNRQRRRALWEQEADVYIINHDGVKVLQKELEADTRWDTMIIDELTQCARNSSTDTWKVLKALSATREWVWGLTGKPVPNGPVDAWAQCRLLTPETVPQYYTHWRNRTMIQKGQFNWVPREDALDTVFEAMQPAVRFSRDECVDLPPVVYETRSAAMTKDQETAYKDMSAKLLAEYKSGEIVAVNAAVKAMRLIQIASGAAYDQDGNTVLIKPKPRIKATLDIIEEAPSKVIVFVPFKATLHMIADEIAKRYNVERIYGGVSKGERDRIFSAFQRTDKPHVLVAQPAAMSHGLTLTAASTIVWFAPVTSVDIYEQANGRISRPGQKLNQLIVHIEGSAAERRVYDALQRKSDLQGALLDMFSHNRS